MTSTNTKLKIASIIYLFIAILIVPFAPAAGALLMVPGAILLANSFLTLEELNNLKRAGKIFDYIKGEAFHSKHPLYESAIRIAPELVLDQDLINLNSGITLIIVSKLK